MSTTGLRTRPFRRLQHYIFESYFYIIKLQEALTGLKTERNFIPKFHEVDGTVYMGRREPS